MIERLSERVGPTGSLEGEGLANILGRPPFDPLTLVLREAGQNIWDARLHSEVPRMLVRIREFSDEHAAALRMALRSGDAREEEPANSDALQRCLADQRPIRVLEICDYGTSGLVGSIDPQSSVSKFVRFFFTIGSAHFKDGQGGTYGYGRSSLYLAGSARTILVHSRLSPESNVERFMASRIGNSYDRRSVRGDIARFTGRHFWGERNEGDRIAPLEGDQAAVLAQQLGMPHRESTQSGTTILIPWPDIPENRPGERVAQILLHNLWPKLVSTSGKNAMRIEVEQDGLPIPVPDPKTHPHYSLFARSLLAVRTRLESSGAIPIQVHRPNYTTGHIAFDSSQRPHGELAESEMDDTPERTFESGVHHVALMRPSELVVRYLNFPDVADGNDWAGVFMCSDDSEIRNAFAASEPPAHDDWVPDRLTGSEATIVRVTKKTRIPEAVNRRFGIPSGLTSSSAGSEHSLASAADKFAKGFLSGSGTAPDVQSSSSGGASNGGVRLRRAAVHALRVEGESTVATFKTGLIGEGPARVRASATIDGLGRSELPPEVMLPHVLRWVTPEGTVVDGDECTINSKDDFYFDVVFMGAYAVVPKCELMDS